MIITMNPKLLYDNSGIYARKPPKSWKLECLLNEEEGLGELDLRPLGTKLWEQFHFLLPF
jgi:hypothetical protein